jgi:hypothetical protein
MSAAQIRDALASLTDRELTLLWHALPQQIRISIGHALHCHLDAIAAAEDELDLLFPEMAA